MELRVKEICSQKGITMKVLADQINVAATTLSVIVGSKGNPTISTLEKIATALGVSITELFETTNNELYGLVSYNGVTYKIDSIEALERLYNMIHGAL